MKGDIYGLPPPPPIPMQVPLFNPGMPLPTPSSSFPRREPGRVLSYDDGKGYGFINCEVYPGEDIYFSKKEVRGSLADYPDLKGRRVEFDVVVQPGKSRSGHNKIRAFDVRLLNDRGGGGRERSREPMRDRPRDRREDAGPLPPLSHAMVDEMIRYLDENGGGSCEFAKFGREFRTVKKAQLDEHFDFYEEGGRLRIALPSINDGVAEEICADGGDPEFEEEDPPNTGEEHEGVIHNYDPTKGYGFVKCPAVSPDDIYFKKPALPVEVRQFTRSRLGGAQVVFKLGHRTDGKPRAENIMILELPGGVAPATRERETDKFPDQIPFEPLSPEKIQEMRDFIESSGGFLNYGRFSNAFPGVKKAQILAEPDFFVLIQESESAGGKWQIALPGVDPFAQQRPQACLVEQEVSDAGDELLDIQPSSLMWLIGCVKRWDAKKQFGFLLADGADDVFIHKNDLPADLHNVKDLVGVEIAFELAIGENGKPKAVNARPIIQPNDTGGWQLRRSP